MSGWLFLCIEGQKVDQVDKEFLGEWMSEIEQNKIFVQSEVGLRKGEG